MLVVNVPIIALPDESRPPLLRLRCEWCIAATIVRFIIVVALCETIETPPLLLLPRERKGAVNAASLKLTPPTSDSPPLPPPLLLLPLLLRAATKEEERADDDDDDDATTAREEKAIQFNSSLEREENAFVRACVRSNVLTE
jgi:hypothetical protein